MLLYKNFLFTLSHNFAVIICCSNIMFNKIVLYGSHILVLPNSNVLLTML